MRLSTVQSRESEDAGKPGRMVAASRDIRRPYVSPKMLSIWQNPRPNKKFGRALHPAVPTYSASPTKWDEETWMSRAGNLFPVTLESCAWMTGGLDKPHRKSTMRASQIFELDPESLAEVYPVESLAPICHLRWWSSPSRWWNVVRLLLHPRNAESLWWWMGQQIRDPVEKIPTELEESIIVALYKGNGVALERRNCRCLKLLDLVKYVLERVSGNVTPQEACIDDIQFSFMSDCSTTNAMLIVCQLQEKFHVVNKTMNMAFVDLEMAFNRVSRRVIWWAFRKLGLEQWLVGLIRSMYENASRRVCIGCDLSEEFIVKMGVHQGSCLSPYCSSRFWKPSFKSFEQDIPGKTGMPMTKSSSLNRWMKCKRSWSSGYLAWEERYFESTWAKPRSWYLARISICFRSPAKSRVPCVFPVSAQTPSSVEVVPDSSTRYTVMSLAL